MNRKVFGIKLKAIMIVFVILVVLIALFAVINRSLLDKWRPQETLVGKWTGQAEIFSEFKKGESPSTFPEDWINIEITINEDGSVTGMVGDAKMENCSIKLNRNQFEKALGIKTDYIINGGDLVNGINEEDQSARRNISIPFDIKDGKISGSLFEVEKWKYPDPLFPRLTLIKE